MKQFALFLAISVLLVACGSLQGNVLTFRTADPSLSINFLLLEPPVLLPTVTPTPEVVVEEEVGEVVPDPTPVPPCVIVKGNISRSGEKIYHLPGQANYEQVKIDELKGEAFYCSEQEAIDAGFRKALR